MNPEKIEHILDDFRQWLQAIPSEATHESTTKTDDPVDLHTLLSQFLAVKQEIHLQTKSVRAQQEQNTQTLDQLSETVQLLGEQYANAEEGLQDQVFEESKPALKALMDLYDVLALSQREAERVTGDILPLLKNLREQQSSQAIALPAMPANESQGSFFGRWFGRSESTSLQKWQREVEEILTKARQQQQQSQDGMQRIEKLLTSLITGYRMGLDRIDRALSAQGLEPIEVIGKRFDPETMEVVGLISDTDRPAGEVIEEARRGYTRNGRVFRDAQVRVTTE